MYKVSFMKSCPTTKNATKLKVFVAFSFLRYKNLQKLHVYDCIVHKKSQEVLFTGIPSSKSQVEREGTLIPTITYSITETYTIRSGSIAPTNTSTILGSNWVPALRTSSCFACSKFTGTL
jgi:hypothetical protein